MYYRSAGFRKTQLTKQVIGIIKFSVLIQYYWITQFGSDLLNHSESTNLFILDCGCCCNKAMANRAFVPTSYGWPNVRSNKRHLKVAWHCPSAWRPQSTLRELFWCTNSKMQIFVLKNMKQSEKPQTISPFLMKFG